MIPIFSSAHNQSHLITSLIHSWLVLPELFHPPGGGGEGGGATHLKCLLFLITFKTNQQFVGLEPTPSTEDPPLKADWTFTPDESHDSIMCHYQKSSENLGVSVPSSCEGKNRKSVGSDPATASCFHSWL